MNMLLDPKLQRLIEVRGQCWIWKGRLGKSRTPVGYIDGKDRTLRRVLREKAGLMMVAGKPVLSICRNTRCVSPACSAYADDPAMIAARIEPMINRTAPNECHRWRGAKSMEYAVIHTTAGSRQVIRMLVKASGVKLRSDDEVSHLCEQRDCCNPAHLMPASPSMNKRFSILQANPEKRMTIDQAREWHRVEYLKERPAPLFPAV